MKSSFRRTFQTLCLNVSRHTHRIDWKKGVGNSRQSQKRFLIWHLFSLNKDCSDRDMKGDVYCCSLLFFHEFFPLSLFSTGLKVTAFSKEQKTAMFWQMQHICPYLSCTITYFSLLRKKQPKIINFTVDKSKNNRRNRYVFS